MTYFGVLPIIIKYRSVIEAGIQCKKNLAVFITNILAEKIQNIYQNDLKGGTSL